MSFEINDLERRARVHAALGDPVRLAIIDTLAVHDASPGELAAALDMPSNLLAHHLGVLGRAGMIVRTRSHGDRRRGYVKLVAHALDALTPRSSRTASRVVFVCTHNSARSQLASALWASTSPVPSGSAGTVPAESLHPRARRIAERHGLDLDGCRPAHVDDVLRDGDLIVAVCDSAHERLARDRRPPDGRLHWSVPDPADTDAAFEDAYTDIADRIDRLAPIITFGATS